MRSIPDGEDTRLVGVQSAQIDSSQELNAMGIPRFLAGTRTATLAGPRAAAGTALQLLDVVRDGSPAAIAPVFCAQTQRWVQKSLLRVDRMSGPVAKVGGSEKWAG